MPSESSRVLRSAAQDLIATVAVDIVANSKTGTVRSAMDLRMKECFRDSPDVSCLHPLATRTPLRDPANFRSPHEGFVRAHSTGDSR